MSDLPATVIIQEEGPREGFQIEGPIPTARKVELIDRLSDTGLKHIQVTSFVSPTRVPGTADAEQVVAGITRRPGVSYTGLWLNDKGLRRAIATERLDVRGGINLCASPTFLARNQNRTMQENLEAQRHMLQVYSQLGVEVNMGAVMAAFGCNFEGEISPATVVLLVGQLLDLASEAEVKLEYVAICDTMAWATPPSIERVIGAVREKWPELELSLHLHDTRGMAIADAWTGLQMGVRRFDAAVAGLGGCPFAAHKGAAGNICTEDLVLLCEEAGIRTGIDLENLLEVAHLAEDIVGHPLPGAVKTGGPLRKRSV
ncbi:MAG: hydroxymethylglutaryl-CoA lyase [Nitratireductor sp.]|nr:hydroxymethylglutaryl-CoA lyase [Nitratireductor sp.]